MSDMGDDFRAMRDLRKEERALHGRPCPECVRLLPKARPTILLPGGWCRIHRYRDSRPYPIEPQVVPQRRQAAKAKAANAAKTLRALAALEPK